MKKIKNTKGSKWHKPVPKTVSNAAMVAMVTMCYFGLVSPTLDFVQTASVLHDTAVNTATTQYKAISTAAIKPVTTEGAVTKPVAKALQYRDLRKPTEKPVDMLRAKPDVKPTDDSEDKPVATKKQQLRTLIRSSLGDKVTGTSRPSMRNIRNTTR